MYLGPSERDVRHRALLRALTIGTSVASTLALSGFASAGATDYQEIMPLVWVMTALSALGAGLTFGIIVWVIYRFRDPTTRRRRYG